MWRIIKEITSMNISELQQIGKEVYKDKPSAYQHKGDMELLEWHIKAMDSLTKAGKVHCIDSALTETEILSIVILEGFGSSQLIQSPLYDPAKSNALNKALIENLDSALKKIPANAHSVLYANDGFFRYDNKIGDTFTIKGYFTTSKDDFDNANQTKWIVKPLPQDKTKAHEIYRIYNHGDTCPYPEWQVEFERGTSFKITDIKKGKKYDIVYIEELP